MIYKNKGFTLIETLLVLSVFLILLSISTILIKPHYQFLGRELFFSQLKSDFYHAQQYSISHQKNLNVYILPKEFRYFIKEDFDGAVIVDRYYSKNVIVSKDTLDLYFQIKPNGNISKFGNLIIEIENIRYKFTIQLGRGRFYVTKE